LSGLVIRIVALLISLLGSLLGTVVLGKGIQRPQPEHDRDGDEHHRRRGHVRAVGDRKSTRLNSSHVSISYAVFCLKKKIVWILFTMWLNTIIKKQRWTWLLKDKELTCSTTHNTISGRDIPRSSQK